MAVCCWSSLEQDTRESDSLVHGSQTVLYMGQLKESGCLGLQPKVGGILHLRLNSGKRPIANKYCEGKMKSTLKRESNSTWNCWKGNVCNQRDQLDISMWLVMYALSSWTAVSVWLEVGWYWKVGSLLLLQPVQETFGWTVADAYYKTLKWF